MRATVAFAKANAVLRCCEGDNLGMWGSRMAEDDQRQKIIKLLRTAEMLAADLQENTLAYMIERAIDHARSGFFPRNVKQAPYWRD